MQETALRNVSLPDAGGFTSLVSRFRHAQPTFLIGDDVIRRYHLAMSTRGFVILSGPSGTGKTWLAQAYAEAAGARVKMVAVDPSWSSNEDLLGYLSPLDGFYHHTPFSEFVQEAAREWDSANMAGRIVARVPRDPRRDEPRAGRALLLAVPVGDGDPLARRRRSARPRARAHRRARAEPEVRRHGERRRDDPRLRRQGLRPGAADRASAPARLRPCDSSTASRTARTSSACGTR